MTEKLTRQEILDLTKVMLRPVRGVPFDVVVEGLCGIKVIHYDKENATHRTMVQAIHRAALATGAVLRKHPIESKRPNEAGNYLEPVLLDTLQASGTRATRPKTRTGKEKSSGYPDIEIEVNGTVAYLECKTYAEGSEGTTFRSFYFSPSSDPKISRDALHFVIGFRLEEINDGHYIAKAFKVVSMDSMQINVKYEFNTNNQDLYSGNKGGKILFDEIL